MLSNLKYYKLTAKNNKICQVEQLVNTNSLTDTFTSTMILMRKQLNGKNL